jgi:uncharacterized heparinase superfamily protein
LPDGQDWVFHQAGGSGAIEPSIFFAAPTGPRNALQIVVTGQADTSMLVHWVLEPLPSESPISAAP